MCLYTFEETCFGCTEIQIFVIIGILLFLNIFGN
jgi:hypothetical protein